MDERDLIGGVDGDALAELVTRDGHVGDVALRAGDGTGDVDLAGPGFDLGVEVDLGEVLRGALAAEYAGADPEQLDEAVLDVFESLSLAEAFSLGNALSQIGRAAGPPPDDPGLRQIAVTALPLAATGPGTVLGGPTGAAVGTSLGAIAAKALAGCAAPAPTSSPPAPGPTPTPVSAARSALPAAPGAPGPPAPTPVARPTASPVPAPVARATAPHAARAVAAAQGLVLSQLPERRRLADTYGGC